MNHSEKICFIPSIDEALQCLTLSHWIKDALRSAVARDPVDAANDAQLLFEILDAHASETVSRAMRQSEIQNTLNL